MFIDKLSTSRLIAEKLEGKHFEDLVAMNTNSQMMATLGGVRSYEASKKYLETNLQHWERYGFGLWIFKDKSGKTVGRGGIRHAVVDNVDETEVAYALLPEFWGKGLATEMAKESIRVADLIKIRELVAFTLTKNAVSRSVINKIGFCFDKEFTHHQNPHVLYRLILSSGAKPCEDSTHLP